MRLIAASAAIVLLLAPHAARGQMPLPRPIAVPAAVGTGLCRPVIAMIERASFIPDRLMQAIAIMESGRRDASGQVAPWPWTINVEGVGQVFDSKQDAIAAVRAHQARGARSIDVGCMQVNLMHHPDAFTSLDDAFDPAANARYAARFLQQLLAQTGSWPRAVAAYHSMTPDIGDDYARKVLAIWARPEGIAPPAPQAGSAPAVPTPGAALPGISSARLLTAPGAAVPALSGRGLDSYRAAPNRMGASFLWRRS